MSKKVYIVVVIETESPDTDNVSVYGTLEKAQENWAYAMRKLLLEGYPDEPDRAEVLAALDKKDYGAAGELFSKHLYTEDYIIEIWERDVE